MEGIGSNSAQTRPKYFHVIDGVVREEVQPPEVIPQRGSVSEAVRWITSRKMIARSPCINSGNWVNLLHPLGNLPEISCVRWWTRAKTRYIYISTTISGNKHNIQLWCRVKTKGYRADRVVPRIRLRCPAAVVDDVYVDIRSFPPAPGSRDKEVKGRFPESAIRVMYSAWSQVLKVPRTEASILRSE